MRQSLLRWRMHVRPLHALLRYGRGPLRLPPQCLQRDVWRVLWRYVEHVISTSASACAWRRCNRANGTAGSWCADMGHGKAAVGGGVRLW